MLKRSILYLRRKNRRSILLLILLFLLPLALGQTGVWWSVVLSQVLTACLALALKTVEDKKISVSP